MRDKSEERAKLLMSGITRAIQRLRDPIKNQRIGQNGRERLLKLMWDTKRDGPGFQAFMQENFKAS